MAERSQSNHIYDSSGHINSTGSANAYVISISEQVNGYSQGMAPIRFKANFGNTGSATANIVTQSAPSGLGAVTLKKNGGATNLASGDIVSGGVYTLIHDGTNFQVMELNGTIPAGSVGTTQLADDSVTYAKIQNVSATSRVLGRKTSGAGDVEECTLSEVLDFIGSAAQGDILYRGASAWERLPAGTSGQFLKTNGSGNNPSWGAQADLFAILGIRYALINQASNNNLAGTYSRTGTTVTVTATAHALQVGHVVNLDFTSGTATDGEFTVTTVADANTFTITHGTSGSTSGNVTLLRHTLTAGSGVANVTDRGTGSSAINFSTAAASANYALLATAHDNDTGGDFIASPPNTPLNTTLVGYCEVQDSGSANQDSPRLTILTVGG